MTEAFTELGLDPRLAQTLAGLGYEEPTPIQQQAIPPLLEGRDVLGQAATGTGKTAAFSLPMLQRLAGQARAVGRGAKPRLLVLVPTRELAMQVSEALFRYSQGLELRVIPVYGGQPIDRQLRRLDQGADIVVATPGRALDHLRRRSLDLTSLQAIVLDEADEMLDMGFAEDLEAILGAAPKERQTALFSATLAPRIARIAEAHLNDPVRIQTAGQQQQKASKVRQVAYIVDRAHKVASLMRVLDVERPHSTLVFCRTRLDVERLTEALSARGYQAESLHGGISQEGRDRVMRQFRSGAADLLIATNVAARGIDVPHLSHVINFEIPSSPEDYVHRIGRTARAGREGVAITLVEPREHRLLRSLEYASGSPIATATLPTVADLRAKQLDLTRASLQEAIVAGELDRFRVVLESLSAESGIMEIALAAIKLVHQNMGGEREEIELPVPRAPNAPRGAAGPGRGAADPLGGRRPQGDMARLFVGAGRQEGIRPADLVGAIANETGMSSRDIGSIEIADHHSIVELPEEVLTHVIDTMKRVALRGARVSVRRDTAPVGPKGVPRRGPPASRSPARTGDKDAPARAGFKKAGFGKPGFGKPGVGKPGFKKPGFGKPGTGKPGTGKPGFKKAGPGKTGPSATPASAAAPATRASTTDGSKPATAGRPAKKGASKVPFSKFPKRKSGPAGGK